VIVAQKQKKRWEDFTPAQKTAIVAGGAVELVLTTITLRDLMRRPALAVRGPKVLWALGFFVQPVGPLLYLTVGRRGTADA
jgi:Phospholipase_D-nuclease N-terminal